MDGTTVTGTEPNPEAGREEAPADIEAVSADIEAVEEAAGRPALGARARARDAEGDRLVLGLAVLAAVVFVFLWIGGTALWGMRRQVSALETRLGSLEAGLAAEARTRNRAALGRILADLEALRRSLPPDRAARVEEASRALGELASDL